MPNRSAYRTWLAAGVLLCGLSAGACEDKGEMTVTGINPGTGHIAGEQSVEILGKHFRTDIGYTVHFGKARAKKVAIRSDSSLAVVTPPGTVGTVDVTVRADDGKAFLMKQAFKYENMAGSVVEGLGEGAQKKKDGNLQF